jgi:anti-sigma factor RsiW
VSDLREQMAVRAEAYLDGELPPDEAAAFERELAASAEVAEALGAALLLRDLLGRMPPLEPPPGLEERILGALELEGRARARPSGEAGEEGAGAGSGVWAALRGTSWLLRPSASVLAGSRGGARPVAEGLGQVRWLLGPIAARRAAAEERPRQPLWRRALVRLGGLG